MVRMHYDHTPPAIANERIKKNATAASDLRPRDAGTANG